MMSQPSRIRNRSQSVLETVGLSIRAPGGRMLFRDLNLRLDLERVALIGRNGVGKTSLLETLANQRSPRAGTITYSGSLHWVGQHLDVHTVVASIGADELKAPLVHQLELAGISNSLELTNIAHWSRGELRKLALSMAKLADPDLLILDEPSQDLDKHGIEWLSTWLCTFEGALLVASHDRRLLRTFGHFFLVGEAGCRYFRGNLAELERETERTEARKQKQYLRKMNVLAERERRNDIINRRRRRKKNGGRVREIGRAPSRALLNSKRSYAQESQGKRGRAGERWQSNCLLKRFSSRYPAMMAMTLLSSMELGPQ